MLRQISLISLLVFLLSALVLLDFKAAQRLAHTQDREPPGFAEHLLGVGSRIAGRIQSGFGGGASESSARLVLMLPAAPDGWDARAIEAGDEKALLAKKDNDSATVSLIQSLLTAAGPREGETALMAYGRQDRLVVFKLVRQPDALFTDPARLSELDSVIAAGSYQELNDFIRVRGLDVGELVLPEGARARVFTAELGGQLRLWVVASGRLTDKDLLPFFETLDVAAMNASIRSHEAGLGEVPVIVVVSELNEADRAAYAADRAAKAWDRAARLGKIRAALAGEPGAAPDSGTEDCKTGPNGVTICAVGG